MKITNNDIINQRNNFKGMGLSPVSKVLYTLSNNDMLNASAVDIFAMDTPRTLVEFNNRGKNAGIEMGFREYTGTFIAEFSAALFAFITSKAVSKLYKPEVTVNSGSWVTNNVLDTLNDIYKNSDKTPEGFVKNTLNAMSGISGSEKNLFASVAEDKAKPVTEGLTKLIIEKNLSEKEVKKLSENIHNGIVDTIKADNNIIIESNKNKFGADLSHVIRDITDTGKNVFFNESEKNSEKIIQKLKFINKSRIMFAVPAAMILAITNQYINRKLTKARTGIDNFVGENDYEKNVKDKNEKKSQKSLLGKKMLSAGVFLLMLSKVMGIKKPADLIKKLEFDGPATGGNTIKTIYGTLILGRIFASKDSTELRETTVRDYLGFLNWLVLGGFVAKGAALIADPKKEHLFNIVEQGKGIKHRLKDVSLKSQKEIIAQGGNIKKNLKSLNIAQATGIAYSAVMLGVLLPKLNIAMTKKGSEKNKKVIPNKFDTVPKMTFENFEYTVNNKKS